MKKLLFTIGLVLPTLFFAQQCDLPANYQEPKPDKKMQSWLKRIDATTEDLRKYIALENDCDEKNVVFLRIAEHKTNGIYSVCVKGKEMKYKRIGTAFMKNDDKTIFDTAK